MNKPLTLEQAEAICKNYQFLEGKPYDKEFNNTTPIQAVLVAPFEEYAQQEFVDDFDLFGYANIAPYKPDEGYDVIVLARYKPDTELCIWMDIRNFVKRNIIQVAKYHKATLIQEGALDLTS